MKKILLNNIKYALLIIVIIIGFNALSPQKSLAVWLDNWTYSTTSIPYSVVIPHTIPTITADYVWPVLNADMMQQVRIRWDVTNYSPNTSCKGSFSNINNATSDPSYDFTGGSMSNPTTGVTFTKSVNTVYTVSCINSFTASVASCSGTYTPIGGTCSGGSVAGSVGFNGALPGPYEGQSCSSLTHELCGAGWITHGCSTWVPSTGTASCVGLSQVSCLASSGCTWTVTTP